MSESNCVIADEVIMNTVDSPGRRGRVVAETENQTSGMVISDVRTDGAFSDRGGTRENGESAYSRIYCSHVQAYFSSRAVLLVYPQPLDAT